MGVDPIPAAQNLIEHLCHRICTNVRPMTRDPELSVAKTKTVALHDAIVKSAYFSSIATHEEKLRMLHSVLLLDAGSVTRAGAGRATLPVES